MKKRWTTQTGFTIVEMMVTLLIFMVMIGGIYSLMLAGDASWQANRTQIELRQELRKGMDWMKDELRQSGGVAVNIPSDDSWNTAIEFQTSVGVVGGVTQWSASLIRFEVGGTGTQLIRTSGGTTKVLAQDIASVRFRRQSATPDVVDIELTASRNNSRLGVMTETLNFNVQMRN
ncbi:MAG: prepilin-type N-terminal cleavage/methylation domain-containing protein [Candidatus Omnitrophica bacterium]|nr:prepilin-type N-terminal cleavage/methylation domain-containing protein [Candidatus Omnitrophota bacterium]